MSSIVSVNVGLPKEIQAGGQTVETGIFKRPVTGPVVVRSLNLDGDRQADLKVHGGVDKAVYLYPSEHYPFWERELSCKLPEWGAFGENLTIQGILEDAISVGDSIEIGTAVLQVTQPRLPCFKLAAKFQRDDIIKRFLDSRRTGFYARVIQEGSLEAGDAVTVRQRDPQRLSVHELTEIYAAKEPDRVQIERVLSVQALSASWRRHFLVL